MDRAGRRGGVPGPGGPGARHQEPPRPDPSAASVLNLSSLNVPTCTRFAELPLLSSRASAALAGAQDPGLVPGGGQRVVLCLLSAPQTVAWHCSLRCGTEAGQRPGFPGAPGERVGGGSWHLPPGPFQRGVWPRARASSSRLRAPQGSRTWDLARHVGGHPRAWVWEGLGPSLSSAPNTGVALSFNTAAPGYEGYVLVD